jgi:N6-L-threonylcarbamoyladenine synthase
MSIILGIESTCDETACAIVADGTSVASSVIASQVELHAKYRGVVPEIASRAHIENILPVIRDAVDVAGVPLGDVDAIAVAHRPGLIGSLLIGVTAAKTLAWAMGKPLIAVDHVQAHLYSVVLDAMREPSGSAAGALSRSESSGQIHAIREKTPRGGAAGLPVQYTSPSSEAPDVHPGLRARSIEFPAVGLVCSGGHTALYELNSWSEIKMIGSTIDDAVGEAYDKVAAILGLGYPGGPILDRLAIAGDPAAIKFPRTMLDRDSLDFSFSGLKTAVLYHVRGVPSKRDPQPNPKPSPNEQEIRNIAASFQAACIDVITKKLLRAIDQFDARSVIIGGGVSANRGLRAALASFPVPVHFPAMMFCTDNAAMIAGLAQTQFDAGQFAGLDLDAITYSQFRR